MGGMPEPSWLAPFLRLRQAEALGSADAAPKKIEVTRRPQFPEDRLIQSFYTRHPNALMEPIDLSSFEPPVVKKIAIRQLALMEAGMSKLQAIKVVEQDMLKKGTLKLAEPPSVIGQIQAEEERVLMAAIQEQKARRLGTTLPP